MNAPSQQICGLQAAYHVREHVRRVVTAAAALGLLLVVATFHPNSWILGCGAIASTLVSTLIVAMLPTLGALLEAKCGPLVRGHRE